MKACSSLGTTLLEMLDVRVNYNIELMKKMAVVQMECESW